MKRIPPYSEEAEQAVLGSLLVDNDGYFKLDGLKKEHFYYQKNQFIFEGIMNSMSENGSFDMITLGEKLKDDSMIPYLAEISVSAPTSSHIQNYIKIVKDKAVKRNLIEVGDRVSGIGFADGEDILKDVAKAKEVLEDALNKSVEDNPQDCQELIEHSFNDYLTRIENKKKGLGNGLPTGYSFMEIEEKELVTVAALPGVGKSILALNIAGNVSKYRKVLFFSFEMSTSEIMYRALSYSNNTQLSKFKKTEYTEEEVARFIDNYKLECPNLKILDKTITIDEIKTICEKEKAVNGLDLVVIDYAQITGDEQDDVVKKTRYVTRKAKMISQNVGCAVVMLSQFNRAGENSEFPTRGNLLGGSSVEQDSNQVWILHNPTLLKGNNSKSEIDPISVLRKCKDRNSDNPNKDYALERFQDSMIFRETNKSPNWLS